MFMSSWLAGRRRVLIMSRHRLAAVATRAARQPLTAVALGSVLVTVIVGLVLLAGRAHDVDVHREVRAVPPAPSSVADVDYMQAMLWHQEQAREMARLVPGRTTRPELRRLARSMLTAQPSDLALTTAWLRAHRVADSSSDARNRPTEQADRWFAGMMAPSQLQALALTSGQRFDFLFVDMLLEHHKGAVVMAEKVLVDGRDAEANSFARRAIAYAKRSIRRLTGWRRRWAEPFIRQLTSPATQSRPASR
jgi:uncharacterized protein (DUF305 family)